MRTKRSVDREVARCRVLLLEHREGTTSLLRTDWRPSSRRVAVVYAVGASTTERKRRHARKPLDCQRLRRHPRCWPRTAEASDERRRCKQTRATMVPSSSHGLRDTANRLADRGTAANELALRAGYEDGGFHPRVPSPECSSRCRRPYCCKSRRLSCQGAFCGQLNWRRAIYNIRG